MQTFSFADSKLGYLTAAKGALVVRVKSCGRATPPVTSPPCVAAADDDVKPGWRSQMAHDETGNFTLVQRRSVSTVRHC